MTEQSSSPTRPRRILLATDLTSGGDRALDRTLQLARDWDARLHIVHAVEASAPNVPFGVDAQAYLAKYPDPKVEAMRLIRRDIGTDDQAIKVHLEEGAAPAQAILRVAERESCDLIVLGEPCPRRVGPLGESTIEQVVRRSPVSVLVVRDRPRGPYRQLLVGTDFTDEAQQALVISAGLFPEATIMLMHAYSMPYASLLETPSDSRDWNAVQIAKLRDHMNEAALPADRKQSIEMMVEVGPPAAMLRRHVLDNGSDLTVIGAHTRGVLFDAVIGRTRRIVDAVPGDILVVRAIHRPPD